MEKLVRDRIPELSGRKDYRTANGPEEFKQLLFAKLHEEVDELTKSPSLEELADVRTVLAFIQTFVLESTEHQVQEAIWEKARNNGLFHSKIVMDFSEKQYPQKHTTYSDGYKYGSGQESAFPDSDFGQ